LPGQLGAIEHVDIAALIAPRPLLAESGDQDSIFPATAARETVEQLRPLYERLDAPAGALRHDVFEGDHRWYGDTVPAFLERWL
jgi:hypothetical protein